jgi:hypothetical protein
MKTKRLNILELASRSGLERGHAAIEGRSWSVFLITLLLALPVWHFGESSN